MQDKSTFKSTTPSVSLDYLTFRRVYEAAASLHLPWGSDIAYCNARRVTTPLDYSYIVSVSQTGA